MNNYQTIVVKEQMPVVQILLNRPKKRHAVNKKMSDELLDVLYALESREDVRVVVLSSTDQYFCAGADLEEGVGEYINSEQQILEMYWPILEKIASMPQVFICAIPGVTAGIGCALALNCDLLVMAPDSALYFAFSKIGLIADGGSHWFLQQQLGYQKTFELLVQGGRLSAQECLTAGLANKINDIPLDAANLWAVELAQCAPLAVKHTKRCLRQMSVLNFKQAVIVEAASQKLCEASEDAKEGISAFLEKRKAVFKGL